VAVAVAVSVAVAVGVSSYWTDATRTQLERTFHNAFFLRFDADGRCAAFTEYFVLER